MDYYRSPIDELKSMFPEADREIIKNLFLANSRSSPYVFKMLQTKVLKEQEKSLLKWLAIHVEVTMNIHQIAVQIEPQQHHDIIIITMIVSLVKHSNSKNR